MWETLPSVWETLPSATAVIWAGPGAELLLCSGSEFGRSRLSFGPQGCYPHPHPHLSHLAVGVEWEGPAR